MWKINCTTIWTDQFASTASPQLVVCDYSLPPSLNPYLPTSMFINLRGPRGACERLVKEHGMLMAWKGYE